MHLQLSIYDHPNVGKMAEIQSVFAIENIGGFKKYCYMEEVVILEVSGDHSIVTSSDRWLEDLKKAGWKNPIREKYKVFTKDLKIYNN